MHVAHYPVVGDGVFGMAELDHAFRIDLLLTAWSWPPILLVLVVGGFLDQERTVLPHVTKRISPLGLRCFRKSRYPLEQVLVVFVDGDPLPLSIWAHEVLPDPHRAIVYPP